MSPTRKRDAASLSAARPCRASRCGEPGRCLGQVELLATILKRRAMALCALAFLAAAVATPAAAQEGAANGGSPQERTTAAVSTDGPMNEVLLVLLVVLVGGVAMRAMTLARVHQDSPDWAPTAPPRAAPPLAASRPTVVPRDGALGRLWRKSAGDDLDARRMGIAAPATLAWPPDPLREWTAEIEWRRSAGGARFCASARAGEAGPVVLAESPALQWPPSDRASVQALTDAAESLAETLAAAGWSPLPPGSAWYAKRFAWTPLGDMPVEIATAGSRNGSGPHTPAAS